MPLLLQPVTFAYALKWATWELNPARRAYKAQQVDQTFAALIAPFGFIWLRRDSNSHPIA
jgi:hypothetical protein